MPKVVLELTVSDKYGPEAETIAKAIAANKRPGAWRDALKQALDNGYFSAVAASVPDPILASAEA